MDSPLLITDFSAKSSSGGASGRGHTAEVSSSGVPKIDVGFNAFDYTADDGIYIDLYNRYKACR
jgi:hypothetical protein